MLLILPTLPGFICLMITTYRVFIFIYDFKLGISNNITFSEEEMTLFNIILESIINVV